MLAASADQMPDKMATVGEDGWLRTGDLAHVSADGFVYVVDRVKDMINRGGEKVWSIDVEEALRALPQVRDAMVAGVPDDVYGEVPVAGVVLADGGGQAQGDGLTRTPLP
ncbi:MAG: AMP-binding protein [Actinomycetaceae bacterium]|nr:AMP-binding protein [Actinomycetaceae bacterium]